MSNYARHRQTKAIVFFTGEPPLEKHEFNEWAFWQVPDGYDPYLFRGQLVGECAYRRCERKRHVPGECEKCRSTYKSGGPLS